MPLETKGWIEYSPYLLIEERENEYSWIAWMDISSIIDTVDETTELLFGYSKRILRNEFKIDAIAKDRGIPRNASDIVKNEMNEIRSFENKFGGGEIFGFSTINYNEIKQLDIPADLNNDWAKLFSLVETFRTLKKLEDEQIRLIVWFEW